jgi:hydroxypyruvate reductase/glycerate 2-kinase
MATSLTPTREQAQAIWEAGVASVRPRDLIPATFADSALPVREAVRNARRIIVIGAGKAGAAMSAALEEALPEYLDRIEGIVNVPAELCRPLRRIRLHPARRAGSNHPTAEGVQGALQILDLVAGAGPDDIVLCLISGGGSALLPAPVAGVSLEDKQIVTRLLHECGATINEMNAARKHLSRIKGGRLAQAFQGRALYSLIISDVVGDPLDVIASGPTAADPTTFADALAVLHKFDLADRVPRSVLDHLTRGAAGDLSDLGETLKTLPMNVHNFVIGNNTRALMFAGARAQELGYPVVNLGSFIEGETRHVATALAGIVMGIRAHGQPSPPPLCLLSGGETTVTLPPDHGRGGRNQEFVLAMLAKLGAQGMTDVVILSGGTDGEDGPTDAAGAMADGETWSRVRELGLCPDTALGRHDVYPFFAATGDLLRTGLTETNVMDVRVILVGPPS